MFFAKNISVASVFIVAVCLLSVEATSDWNYDEADSVHGPDHWVDTYTDCGGDHQSPINIDTHEAEEDDHLADFQFEHFEVTDGVTMELENDGHTAKLTLTGTELSISHGNLLEDYVFDQLHFHWGHDDTVGSEHAIDDHYYPLEMHLVHHSSDFADLDAAVQEHHGLAVLGFLFEISEHDNEDLTGLIAALDDIHDPEAHHSVTTFSLEHLIHDAVGSYYRYSGSLTTPGCYESVIWTLFDTPLHISSSQLAHFRALHDDDDADITDNHRPVQSLNSRHVYHHSDHHSDATSAALSSSVIVMTAMIAVFF